MKLAIDSARAAGASAPNSGDCDGTCTGTMSVHDGLTCVGVDGVTEIPDIGCGVDDADSDIATSGSLVPNTRSRSLGKGCNRLGRRVNGLAKC